MHFSIPDTVQANDDNGSSYWNFHIHVNGVYHCKLRYSQLDKFHEQLRAHFPERTPSKIFPGKKLFSLSGDALEQRREALESFIQHVSQDPVISASELFNSFLLNAQREGWEDAHDVDLNIYLMNGKKVVVGISTNDQTDDVFEKICERIHLDKKFFHYFALFLIQQQPNNNIKIVRRLQEFESPYLSLKTVQSAPHKIVIRKNYCASKFDDDIMEDRVAMNLLYVQVADDFERGWMLCNNNVKQKLEQLQKTPNSRVEFLRLAQTCKFYGYTHFAQCVGDYPAPDSKLLVCCGERELNTRIRKSDNSIEEGSFRVQRIRSWRLTSVPNSKKLGEEEENGINKETLFFAFEYLFAKDDLRWISLKTDQAIMLSMTLQSMVDEIIRETQGKGVPGYLHGRDELTNQESSSSAHINGDTGTTAKKVAAPFSHNTRSGAFSWKSKKEDNGNRVFDQQIGDNDL